ncbi:hypothetical protein [Rubritalea tangerina]
MRHQLSWTFADCAEDKRPCPVERRCLSLCRRYPLVRSGRSAKSG